MSSFASSPMWGVVMSAAGTAMGVMIAGVLRVLGKVSRIEDKITEVASDVNEIKNDRNIVRWSELARDRRRRRRYGF